MSFAENKIGIIQINTYTGKDTKKTEDDNCKRLQKRKKEMKKEEEI